MKVLYFGAYNSSDQRNAIIMDGLRQNGIEIIECQDSSSGLVKFFKLFVKHWKVRNQYDLIFVGFLSHILMPLAVLINSPIVSYRSRKPLILDGFMSLYDSNVFGRQKYKPQSFWGYYYWLVDWVAFHLGDRVLFDTKRHIEFISKEFGIKKDKMARSFAGARENIFQPLPYKRNDSKFRVLFHGTFIPSQGIEFILQAAKTLEKDKDIEFLIIGDGQVKNEMLELAKKINVKNVEFLGRMNPGELVNNISQADVCLGLFGRADKIQRVIPTKVFECAAMARPVITGEAPAVRELFNDESIMFVKIADPDDLVRGILNLKNDPELREKLAKNGYELFKKNASAYSIGKELKSLMVGLQKGPSEL